MSRETDAALIARLPHEEWDRPLPVTNLETREVRYDCRLCMFLGKRQKWETLSADEAVMFAHIKEAHGLEPVASVYVSPRPEDAKATGLAGYLGNLRPLSKFIAFIFSNPTRP